MDLLVAGWGLNPGIEMDFYRKPDKAVHAGRLYMPANVEYELKFNRFFKFDSFSTDLKWQDMYKAKLPNLTMLQREEMVNNFDPLLPGRYQTWIEELDKLDQKSSNSILDMMGVSTIVDLTENGVVENEINLEPEFVRIKRAIYVSGGDADILNLLMEGKVDTKTEMILAVPDSFRSDQCGGSIEGEVGVLEQRPGYIKLKSQVEEKSWIFWSQSWYPGWKAIIDGEETVDVQRSNFIFQAACVPAGIHEIEFIYQPNSFKIGTVISMISIGTMLVCVRFQRRKNQE
ncbi:MAG: YfhO family protein [Anaerolineales bacterium]|nr:YfhO family protein [Anaerolineales bacterium]